MDKIRRNKPLVAFETEVKAKNNLNAKLELLIRLSESMDESVHLLIPKSITKFNAWSSEMLPVSMQETSFASNAKETLKAHSEIFNAVRAILLDLRGLSKTSAKNRDTKIESLKRDKFLHKVLKTIAEEELAYARRDLIRSNTKILALQAQLSSTEKYCSQKLEKLELLIDVLRTENSKLTKALTSQKKLERLK